jgi:CrcB protein
MITYLAIAVFGIGGCWGRYWMTNFVQSVAGRQFPFATLSINLLGSFLMGFLSVATLQKFSISPPLRTGILTGFVGGYTTFSTFAMEALLLSERGQQRRAILYLLVSEALGLCLVFFGSYVAQMI